jgi:hypothetical protein
MRADVIPLQGTNYITKIISQVPALTPVSLHQMSMAMYIHKMGTLV